MNAQSPGCAVFGISCSIFRAIVLLACVASFQMACRADTPKLNSTTFPYVGVTLSHYSASTPQQNINVVDIDLAAPGIQFRVTPQVSGLPLNSSNTPYTVTRQFTLDFMANQGAQIAVDASGITGSHGADNGVRKAVSHGPVNALEIDRKSVV